MDWPALPAVQINNLQLLKIHNMLTLNSTSNMAASFLTSPSRVKYRFSHPLSHAKTWCRCTRAANLPNNLTKSRLHPKLILRSRSRPLWNSYQTLVRTRSLWAPRRQVSKQSRFLKSKICPNKMIPSMRLCLVMWTHYHVKMEPSKMQARLTILTSIQPKIHQTGLPTLA